MVDAQHSRAPHLPRLLSLLLCGAVVSCTEPTSPPEPSDQLSMEIAGGNGQEIVSPVGIMQFHMSSMDDSLKVKVTDQDGQPRAGVSVAWSAAVGRISPATSQTDASGIASAYWTIFEGVTAEPRPGSYMATASVADVGQVDFTSRVRAGITIQSVSFSPNTVDLGTGDGAITVTAHLTDDRAEPNFTAVSAQIYNPSASLTEFQSVIAHLDLDEGTFADGVWSGTITLPADAERGAWYLGRMVIGWGCGGMNRVELTGDRLEALGLRHELHVVGELEANENDASVQVLPVAQLSNDC